MMKTGIFWVFFPLLTTALFVGDPISAFVSATTYACPEGGLPCAISDDSRQNNNVGRLPRTYKIRELASIHVL